MSRYYENSPSRGSNPGRGKFGNRGNTPRGGKSGLSRGGDSADSNLRGGRGRFNNRGRGGSPGRGSFTPRGRGAPFTPRGRGAPFTPRGRGASFNSPGRGGHQQNSSFESGPPTPCKFLFVKGFSKTTEISDIKKLVKNAVNIHHRPGTQFATIEFNDIDAAKEAITTLKSKEIDGNRLIVHFDRKSGGGTPNNSFKQDNKLSKKYNKPDDTSDKKAADGSSAKSKNTKSISKPKIVNGDMSDEEEEDEDKEIDDEEYIEDKNESDESEDDTVKVKSAKSALKQVKEKLDAEEDEENEDEDNEDEDIEDEDYESYLSEEDLDDTDDKEEIETKANAKTIKAPPKQQFDSEEDDESDPEDFSLPPPKGTKEKISTKKSADVKSAIVHLENVPKKAHVDEIKKLVANIVSVEKSNGKTFAKVKFSNIKSAEAGINKLNGVKLRGNILKASFFADQSPNVKKTESAATEKVKAESKKSAKPVVEDESDEDEEIDDEDELEDEDDDDSLADEFLDREAVEDEGSSDEDEDNVEDEEDDDSDEEIEEMSPPIKKAGILKTPVEKSKEKKQVKLTTTNTNDLTPRNAKMGGAVSAQSTPHPSVGKLLRTQDGNAVQVSANSNRKRKASDSIATDQNAKRSNTMANGEPVDEAIVIEEERRRKERDARTLFVNNVEKKLDFKHVKKILPNCVNIKKGANATFAFLTFDSEAAAIKAKKHIDNKPFCLCKLRVTVDFVGEKSTKEGKKSTSGELSEHAAKRLINPLCLYVGNLPPGKSYTKAKIVKYFPNATAVRCPKKKHRVGSYMFVDFASAQDARSAFDNNANLSIDDHVVEVCYARMNNQEQALHKVGDAAVVAATKAQKKRSKLETPIAPSNAQSVKMVKVETSNDEEDSDDIELESGEDEDEEMDEMDTDDNEDYEEEDEIDEDSDE